MKMEPFAAEREWTVEGIPVLSAEAAVPQPVPAADRTARRIRRYYQLQLRAFLRYCEKWLLPQAAAEYRAALAASAPLPSFRAELRYEITYQDERFLSLYTQSREVTTPGQTLLTRRGDTWDLAAGYPVPLTAFFPPRSPWRRKILSVAAEEIRRQERAGIARYHEGWPRLLRRRFNPQNYCLTPEGLAVFFPMYAIAPAAEGIPTFVLPYGGEGPRGPADPAPGEAEG